MRPVSEIRPGLSESAKADLRRELEDAMVRGDRVMVFWLRRDVSEDLTTVHAMHYSAESCKTPWLAFLGALHSRLHKWHSEP